MAAPAVRPDITARQRAHAHNQSSIFAGGSAGLGSTKESTPTCVATSDPAVPLPRVHCVAGGGRAVRVTEASQQPSFAGSRKGRASCSAADRKLRDMSSKIFGENVSRCGVLSAEDVPSGTASKARNRTFVSARRSFHENQRCSPENIVASKGICVEPPPPAGNREEEAVIAERRRTEPFYSDLFGRDMGRPSKLQVKHGGITSCATISPWDTRTEIASRAANGRKPKKEAATAVDRLRDENDSSLFGYKAPAAPLVDPKLQQELMLERGTMEAQTFDIAGEIARRRRQKDHLNDFEPKEGDDRFVRKQRELSSLNLCTRLGIEPPCRHQATKQPSFSVRVVPSHAQANPSAAGKSEQMTMKSLMEDSAPPPSLQLPALPPSGGDE